MLFVALHTDGFVWRWQRRWAWGSVSVPFHVVVGVVGLVRVPLGGPRDEVPANYDQNADDVKVKVHGSVGVEA